VSQSALLSRSVSSGPKLYPRWSFDREALTTFLLVTLRSVRHTRRTAWPLRKWRFRGLRKPSGGLPIRQNRQLPKARHGAGARSVQRKAIKCFIKTCSSFFYHYQASVYRFFMLDVHVFVKQHKLVDLVQYIVLDLVESIFCFYCITVRPAIYLCLKPEIS